MAEATRACAPSGEGVQAGRERRAGPAPAQRVEEGRGLLGKAGLGRAGPGRAGPCLQLPLHSGGSYKLRRLAPRTRRPAPRTTSHRNPAPLLRRAGLCPSPGAYLAKGRTATKAAFLFFFFLKKRKKKFTLLRPFSGALGTTGHSPAAKSPQSASSAAVGSPHGSTSPHYLCQGAGG